MPATWRRPSASSSSPPRCAPTSASRSPFTPPGWRCAPGESIPLPRAWLALRRGDVKTARRLFDEVEAPLETKLRSDLGSGEPLFAEWFLHAAALWAALGDTRRARWAAAAGRASAPESRLPDFNLKDIILKDADLTDSGRLPLQ